MADKKICDDQECKCPYHKNENGFEIDSIIQTNPNDNSSFNVAKKHLNVKQIIIKKNHQTNHKKVELMDEAKVEIKPKKPSRKRTIEEIYEFLQREGQKNEEFRNKQEQWNQKQDERMNNFENQIQYSIETSLLTLQYFLIIFQLPTIKKELVAMGYNPGEMNQKIQDQIEKSKEVVKKKDEDN